jgi:DNA-binding transcriptional ArsR family regulator
MDGISFFGQKSPVGRAANPGQAANAGTSMFDVRRISNIQGAIMVQEPYHHPDLAEVTHALSDPVRLGILRSLAPGAETAWNGFMVKVAPSTLSHHMKVLRNAGLITNRRDGMRCLVSLRPELSDRFPGLLETILRLNGQSQTVR